MKKVIDLMSKTGKWLLVFGIVFSQLSFPLSVLADENKNNDLVITINGEETTNYEISGNTEVKVVLENQGTIIEEKTFNFNNKLYGIYQYTFISTNETITINYPGNNADLLSQYENVTNDFSKTLTYNEKDCIISGFGKDLLTVEDITSNYYNISTFENYYSAKVEVTNGEQILSATDAVNNGYQLKITNNQTELTLVDPKPSTYTINRVGDTDASGVIDTSDREAILDDILQSNELTNINDTNLDAKLNILDATNSLFTGNDTSSVTPEKLIPSLTIDKSEILIGEEVELNLFLSGFDKLSLIGIEGVLEYNSDVLELVSAKVDELTYSLGYLNNDKFAYILTGFNNHDSAIITLKFKALTTGISNITISNIIGSYGESFELENDNVTTSVTVLNPEDSKGGDVEENTTTQTEITPTTVQNTVKPVVLSNDYYIKNLIIKGYDIDFDTNTYEYSIKVGNDVNSLDIEVLLNSNKSIYYMEGNENFKAGENIVSIVVKAENGSTKTYTITVEKEEKAKKATEIEEETEEKNTSKTIIIILIILVIIGLIYVIFKDDEEDEKEIKNNNKEKAPKENKKETKQDTKKESKKKKKK